MSNQYPPPYGQGQDPYGQGRDPYGQNPGPYGQQPYGQPPRPTGEVPVARTFPMAEGKQAAELLETQHPGGKLALVP